jgi:hypothetical protein
MLSLYPACFFEQNTNFSQVLQEALIEKVRLNRAN